MANTAATAGTRKKRRYRRRRKYAKRATMAAKTMHFTTKELAAFKLGMQVGRSL
jgi:hypothetical protein